MRSSGMPRSTPAQNARPSARTITTRISSSKRSALGVRGDLARRLPAPRVQLLGMVQHDPRERGLAHELDQAGAVRLMAPRSLASARSSDLSPCMRRRAAHSDGDPIFQEAPCASSDPWSRRNRVGRSRACVVRAYDKDHALRRSRSVDTHTNANGEFEISYTEDPVPRLQRDPARSLRAGLRRERQEACCTATERETAPGRGARALRDQDPAREAGRFLA